MVVRWISRLAPATLVLVAITAGTLFAAGSASASHHLIRSYTNGGCLRTASNGQVSLLPCRDADPTQHWRSWNNGWTRNVYYGYCLVSTDTEEAVRATAQCNPNARDQWWSHHANPSTGWGPYAQTIAGRDWCLVPLGSEVTLSTGCWGRAEALWRKFPLRH